MNSENSTGKPARLSFADALSPIERARRGLQDELSLLEIGKLTFPDNAELQQKLVDALVDSAKAGELPVYGNPDGWWIFVAWEHSGLNGIRLPRGKNGYADNPYPRTDLHLVQGLGPYPDDYDPWHLGVASPLGYHSACCLVSRADYFTFLKTPLAAGIPEPKWPAPALESILPDEPSLPATPDKRQRIDALGNAIQAALSVLSPSGKPLPRPHELFDYLATSDSTRTITGVAKGNRKLLWIDDNGNEQPLTFSALSKRLNRLKKGD